VDQACPPPVLTGLHGRAPSDFSSSVLVSVWFFFRSFPLPPPMRTIRRPVGLGPIDVFRQPQCEYAWQAELVKVFSFLRSSFLAVLFLQLSNA